MKLQFIIFQLFFISYLFSGQGSVLFEPLQHHMKRYRQYIEEKDIKVNNGVIYLELNGRRTNLKSLFLLGFHSVGRTVGSHFKNTDFSFREVNILIHYEMKNSQEMTMTASIESVLELSQGKINSEQFFNAARD